MAVSANRLELLQIVDAVAREKSIDRSIVLASMEDAMQKAARSRYGQETEVRADINPKTGEIRFSRLLLVVDQIENDATQITLADAQKKNPSAQIGDWIAESLPPFDYGRIPAQASKQVLVQKIREAERDKQYDVYKDRIGEIINGQVKRVEYGNVVVDLGGAGAGEAVVRRDELVPARDVPPRRPHPRLCLRRPPRSARTADFPLAHASAIHRQAVHAGSAGDLRRHRGDKIGRPRSGLAREDRGGLQRFLDRSGRRLRRHARLARAGGRQRVAGREDRHHPLVARRRDLHRQRAAARGSDEGGARRGFHANRGRRARRSAFPGDRPARPERSSRLAIDGVGHRHSHRGRGIGAPAEGIRRTHQHVHDRAGRR